MLVFGDVSRREDARRRAGVVQRLAVAVGGEPPGLLRHAALVTALVEAGLLVQGIADAEGETDATPSLEAALGMLMPLARATWRSWRTGFQAQAVPPLAALSAQVAEGEITTRLPEGFAFYALYPESYGVAALSSGLNARTTVIGIRSIGTTLGAMVSAALDAPAPLTVRPAGHPFARRLDPTLAWTRRLEAGRGGAFAVADEGPGLSGSSFGAVLDALDEAGVPEAAMAVFPSHAGALGPQASAWHRDRWGRLRKPLAPLDALIIDTPHPAHRLDTWLADLLGPLEGPPMEVSGGGWRALQGDDRTRWPPVHPWQERRKWLVRAGGVPYLARFNGLGQEGLRKAALRAELAGAGFCPPVIGLRHGFLVERWMEEARRLDPAAHDRMRLAERVGRYLGVRARMRPAGPGRGASLADLLAMARHNAGLALGAEAAGLFNRITGRDIARLEALSVPVETDNRLQAWEWLVMPDGSLLKADAADHHAGHDLVGCQDIAWDAAGAIGELGLAAAAEARLLAAIERESGLAVAPALLRILRPCYHAFQLGSWTLAAEASQGDEAVRTAREAGRHRAALARLLERSLL